MKIYDIVVNDRRGELMFEGLTCEVNKKKLVEWYKEEGAKVISIKDMTNQHLIDLDELQYILEQAGYSEMKALLVTAIIERYAPANVAEDNSTIMIYDPDSEEYKAYQELKGFKDE